MSKPTHNPDCQTCTYAWCCGRCYCCKPEPRPSYRFEHVWTPKPDALWQAEQALIHSTLHGWFVMPDE